MSFRSPSKLSAKGYPQQNGRPRYSWTNRCTTLTSQGPKLVGLVQGEKKRKPKQNTQKHQTHILSSSQSWLFVPSFPLNTAIFFGRCSLRLKQKRTCSKKRAMPRSRALAPRGRRPDPSEPLCTGCVTSGRLGSPKLEVRPRRSRKRCLRRASPPRAPEPRARGERHVSR